MSLQQVQLEAINVSMSKRTIVFRAFISSKSFVGMVHIRLVVKSPLVVSLMSSQRFECVPFLVLISV